MGPAGIFASGTGLVELRAAWRSTPRTPRSRAPPSPSSARQLRKRNGGSVGPASIPGTDAAIEVRVPGSRSNSRSPTASASNGQTKFVLGLAEASVDRRARARRARSPRLPARTQRRDDARRRHPAQRDRRLPDVPQPARRRSASAKTPPISQLVPLRCASATTLAGGAKSLGRRSAAAAPGARAGARRLTQAPSITRKNTGRPSTTRSTA